MITLTRDVNADMDHVGRQRISVSSDMIQTIVLTFFSMRSATVNKSNGYHITERMFSVVASNTLESLVVQI